jgi:putative sterol carrier protein
MLAPFTQPWADAFRAAINADAAYQAAARNWTWPVALVVGARPDLGIMVDMAVEAELDRGHCSAARAVPADRTTAPFVLRGEYDAWKRVVRGELDPVLAVTTGKLRLERGALTTLMLHTTSARALVACARMVPTAFPDETG